jgi:glutamine synthetase
MIIPAALRHQMLLAEAVAATENAGVDCGDTVKSLEAFAALVGHVRKTLALLETAAAHQDDEPLRHATHLRSKVRPAMAALREAVDEVESHVSADLWPMPTYRELLFLK